MKFADLDNYRKRLGLTILQMALVLGVGNRTYDNWRQKQVPKYIQYQIEIMRLLSSEKVAHIIRKRLGNDV